MALTRVQCSIQGGSGLPADRFVNTFYVESVAEPSEAEHGEIAEIFSHFYLSGRTETPAYSPLQSFMAGAGFVTGTSEDLTIKTYSMAEPEQRVPKVVATYNIVGGGTPLPTQLAVCMSFKAAPLSGVPVGRRRGRIFLGPLNTDALAMSDEGNWDASRPDLMLRVAVIHAGQRLGQELVDNSMAWVIHSPTTGPMAAFEVAEVSCDNAFDIIRSRGLTATGRDSLPVPV